jgi:hypothetical protein
MHDGGTNMNLYINNNMVCNSTMFYTAGMTPSHGDMNMRRSTLDVQPSFGGDHISSPGACTDFGEIKLGDVLTSEAVYDMTIHKTQTHDGKQERLMGNMRVYMGPE